MRPENALKLSMIVIVVLSILLFMEKCSGSPDPNCNVFETHDTLYVHDTVEVSKEFKFKPSLFTEVLPDSNFIDSLPSNDSIFCEELITDHYTKREYLDTIKSDSGYVVIDSFVSENRLDSVKGKYHVTIPFIKTEIINTTTVTPCIRKNQWCLTADLGTNFRAFSAEPEFFVIDKKNIIYGASAQFVFEPGQPIDVYYKAKIGFKFHFPSRKN